MLFDHDHDEMTTTAADLDLDLSFGIDDTATAARRSGGTVKRGWVIGATAAILLLSTIAIALVLVFTKQPADITPVAAAASLVANNNLAACCVNIATDTCHATVKCNKKEKNCEKCIKKTGGNYKWMVSGTGTGNPPAPAPGPPTPPSSGGGGTTDNACCVIIATNTCHVDEKCNKKEKNCLKDKCQKTIVAGAAGQAKWKVRNKQSPVPTSTPTHAPSNTPTTAAPSHNPTQAPSAAPTSQPTFGPTPAPTTPTPSTSPTHGPTKAPVTDTPTAVPTQAPTSQPTKNPTTQPTLPPTTAAPTLNDSTVYEYTDTGKSCSIGGGNNVQGPLPLADKRNVVIDFWAFGDSPYDFMVDTCLDKDGNPSTCRECAVRNSDMMELPYPNSCTFEGEDFECVKESIIPFMNRKMNEGDGAFQVHMGDILKGTNAAANSHRCTEASFASRAKLFQPAKNFLLINGDNESNECFGYDIKKASDPVRDMWRQKFGKYSFTSDFPPITGGGRPSISRVAGNEEIFGFEYKNIAFFGLDYPAGDAYITKHAPQDLNAKFVKETLASDTSCALRSIVLFSHIAPRSPVDEALDEYFVECGVLPTLTVLGNAHPSTYCLTKKGERLSLTVEAFRSGPLLVTVLRDPKEGGGDYFHVADSDLVNSNSKCPEFA